MTGTTEWNLGHNKRVGRGGGMNAVGCSTELSLPAQSGLWWLRPLWFDAVGRIIPKEMLEWLPTRHGPP